MSGFTFWTPSCSQRGRFNNGSNLTRHVSDELLLPHMKRVDGMITDNRKRLLHKLPIGQVLKVGVLRTTHLCFVVSLMEKRISAEQVEMVVTF